MLLNGYMCLVLFKVSFGPDVIINPIHIESIKEYFGSTSLRMVSDGEDSEIKVAGKPQAVLDKIKVTCNPKKDNQ